MDKLKELQLMICTSNGIRFGFDLEQISEILEFRSADNPDIDLICLQKKLQLKIDPRKLKSKKVLTLKATKSSAITINEPEEIRKIPIEKIAPIPELIRRITITNPIWGVIAEENEFIFILDAPLVVAKNPIADLKK